PTWEGWGDDPHHTSLPHVGARLVESLLQAGVRVVYRPHPLTGVRNVAVRRADEAVTALLRAAGGVGPEAVPAPDAERVRDDLLDDAVASAAGPGRATQRTQSGRSGSRTTGRRRPAHRASSPARDPTCMRASPSPTRWSRTCR